MDINNTCSLYKTNNSCYLNDNCAWCTDPHNNFSYCVSDYDCFEKDNCYSQKNEMCGILNIFHNLVIITGLVTSSILIFSGVSKCLLRTTNFTNENVNSTSCSFVLVFILPVVAILFLNNTIFMPAYISYLSFSLLLNFILFR